MTAYLLRLNLDIKEPNFKDQLRFKLAASSIKSLSKTGNKIIILSHLGRPKGTDRNLSLRRFIPALSTISGKKVRFISHFNFLQIKKEIDSAPGGSVFLLENLRFLPGESKNSRALAKNLATLGNRYINNDFANSHRAHASMSAITDFLPSAAGALLKNEIRALKTIKDKFDHPFVLIIGGAKMADKVVLMRYLLPKADYILVGGGSANNFLKLRKINIGSSIYEPRLTQTTKLLLRNKKVIIPVDWKKDRGKILDIGPETIKRYSSVISQARTIIWNGPMGYFEDKKFAAGTTGIAKAIFKNKKARVVIGGVETTAALFRVSPRSVHVSPRFWLSTGGGAMLEFLAGKKLPAVEALKQKL